MCLFKVHEEPDIVVPYKVHHRHSSSHHHHHGRHAHAHAHIIDDRHHSSHLTIPPPEPLSVPPPAPIPAIVAYPPTGEPPLSIPPPAPSVHSHHGSHHHHGHGHGHHDRVHYVEVSPSRGRSSSSSSSSSDGRYVYHREVHRDRVLDPPPPRLTDEYETYRYVQAPEVSYRTRGSRSRSRSRSASRRRYVEEPVERVQSTRIVLEDGRRRKGYRH